LEKAPETPQCLYFSSVEGTLRLSFFKNETTALGLEKNDESWLGFK